MSVIVGLDLQLLLYAVDTGELVEQIDVPAMGFPLGIAFDPDDELALVPVPGANLLVVAELGGGEVRQIEWQDVPGPSYLTLEGLR